MHSGAAINEIHANEKEPSNFMGDGSVFQGTVLGPPSWNVFFGDAHLSLEEGYVDTTYADDKNAYKRFGRDAEHDSIYDDMRKCQDSLHEWGQGNQVVFDPSKKSFHILHRLWPSNTEFKILGVLFDSQLRMHAAVRSLATQGGWRLKALLRARRFFDNKQLVALFKSQILSFIEAGIVAFVHAPVSTFAPVDRILRRFLRAKSRFPK